jgi:hypothetical protein
MHEGKISDSVLPDIRDSKIADTVCSKYFTVKSVIQCSSKYVSRHSFVNRTIKTWNQLPAGLLASFPSKLNTFRKRVENVVTSK